jgi:hypothetical protein
LLLPVDAEHEPLHGYVASALTGLGDDSREAIIFASHNIANVCKTHELYVYQPRKADPLLHPDVSAAQVYRLDRRRVVGADVLFILANRPSFGVGQELEIAASYSKPTVFVMRDDVTLSRMTKGSFANVVGEIVYSGPEDLEKQLAKLLDEKIDKLRQLKKHDKRSHPIPLGSRLAELRQGAGYTLVQVSEMAGVSEALLEAVEDGQYENVGFVVLGKLCPIWHQHSGLSRW